jgi:hypothetical protein
MDISYEESSVRLNEVDLVVMVNGCIAFQLQRIVEGIDPLPAVALLHDQEYEVFLIGGTPKDEQLTPPIVPLIVKEIRDLSTDIYCVHGLGKIPGKRGEGEQFYEEITTG